MVDIATERDIATIPKVELHVHLQGSITAATASELARRHGADPQTALGLQAGNYPGRYTNFEGFLDTYFAVNQFVRTPDDLEFVAAEFARAQAAQAVIYSEVFFTAMICVRNGMEPSAMWAALRRGLAAAGTETRVGLVVDAIRDFGRPEAEATLRVVEAAEAPIVGLCLTGREGTVPTTEFVDFRAEARRLGLGFEVHAGEMGPPSSIAESINILEVDRIGHGVAAIHDPVLLDRLVRDQVVLDVCPSSNVGTGLFPSLATHPVAAFWQAGVNMTISSDDPPFFNTTLINELSHVARLADLSRAWPRSSGGQPAPRSQTTRPGTRWRPTSTLGWHPPDRGGLGPLAAGAQVRSNQSPCRPTQEVSSHRVGGSPPAEVGLGASHRRNPLPEAPPRSS